MIPDTIQCECGRIIPLKDLHARVTGDAPISVRLNEPIDGTGAVRCRCGALMHFIVKYKADSIEYDWS